MQPQRSPSAAKARLITWLLVLLCFCSAPPLRAAQEIRLGEINPLSGNLAKHGLEIHQGILYAVEEEPPGHATIRNPAATGQNKEGVTN